MYLVVIAWLYVTLMMAVAEAASPTGSLLGAAVTFALYGLLPLSIVIYIMGTPARKRKLRARELAQREAWQAQQNTPAATGSECAPPAADASAADTGPRPS
jgi:membrane protein implicated in regulation of membrane protease activity